MGGIDFDAEITGRGMRAIALREHQCSNRPRICAGHAMLGQRQTTPITPADSCLTATDSHSGQTEGKTKALESLERYKKKIHPPIFKNYFPDFPKKTEKKLHNL